MDIKEIVLEVKQTKSFVMKIDLEGILDHGFEKRTDAENFMELHNVITSLKDWPKDFVSNFADHISDVEHEVLIQDIKLK